MFKKKDNLRTAILAACMGASVGAYAGSPTQPNIVTIMVDDMGYSDFGMFGSEIDTPNIDTLISQGTQLTNFYSAPTSTPARAMFFTGRDNHPAGVGNMDGYSPDRPPQKNVPGYEGRLTSNLPIFPELLQGNNYHTIMTGKWDLGDKPGEYPSDRGFNETLVLLPGGDVHFLSDKDGKLITSQPPGYYKNLGITTPYNKNGKQFSAFPPNAFSTDFYTDEAIKLIDARPDTTKPFYVNIAHIAPHGPFQAPPNLINKYLSTYGQGWDKLRVQRFEKLKSLGLVKANAVLPPRQVEVLPWDKLSADQQAVEIRRMAAYAGLMDKFDQSVGKLVQHLKDIGEYDNTVFFVMSDNGAAAIEAGSPAKQAFVNSQFTKDSIDVLANIGAAKSFIPPSPGLGMLNNTPMNRFKAETFEGGIHTAAFVFSPKADARAKGAKYNCLTTVMDFSATILDLSKTVYPTSYKGVPIAALDGTSMSKIFRGDLGCSSPDRSISFEQDSAKMVRIGNWKLAQQWNDKNQRWDGYFYLFNLANDPFEQRDLSKSNRPVYNAMLQIYKNYAVKNRVIDIGPRIFSPIADLKMQPAIPGGMILGGSQVNYLTFQHVPALPQAASPTSIPPRPALPAPKIGDNLDVAAELYPPTLHQGKPAQVMVASYHKQTGVWRSYKQLKNANGHPTTTVSPLPKEIDDGSVFPPNFNLVPKFIPTLKSLPARFELPIFEDKLVAKTPDTGAAKKPDFAVGTHYFWVAYKLSDGTIQTSASPITVNVNPAPVPAPK